MLPSEVLQALDEQAGRVVEPVAAYVDDGRLLDALNSLVCQTAEAMRARHYDPALPIDDAPWCARSRMTLLYPRALRLSLQTLLAHVAAGIGLTAFLMSIGLHRRPPPTGIDVVVQHDPTDDTTDSVRLRFEYALTVGHWLTDPKSQVVCYEVTRENNGM
jgi:hypothetical protein